jgi:hypothetical protein
VAGRLANLDHNLQVMLIEAGENNLNNPWVSNFVSCTWHVNVSEILMRLRRFTVQVSTQGT